MHGRMHPNYCQITILSVVDLCSSLAYMYFMMTQPLPIASKKLGLLGNYQQMYIHVHRHSHAYVHVVHSSIMCGISV